MEEEIQRLSAKERLDGDDASTLLQLLQDQATPVLSLRSLGGSPVASTRQPISRRNREQQTKPLHSAERGGRRSGARERVSVAQASEEVPRSRQKHRGASHSESRRGHPAVSPSESQHASTEKSESVAVLDVNRLEDFPPLEKAMLDLSRKREKGLMPRRRITLTSVPSGPSTTQFSSPPPWSSHPAFITGAPTNGAPSPLSEERRLLRQERSRRGSSGNQKRPATHSQDAVQVQSQPLPSSQKGNVVRIQSHSLSSGKRTVGREIGREQQHSESPSDGLLSYDKSGRGSHSSLGGSASFESLLDARISGHMIHDLSRAHKKSSSTHVSKDWPSNEPVSHKGSVDGSNKASLDLGPSDSIGCVSSTLTSTPLPVSVCTTSNSEVSVSNVSNKEALESAAELYSTLMLDRLVPNLTSEIHFLVQLLTATVPAGPVDSLPCSEQLFRSIDNCVYFAVAVLNKTRRLLSPLDRATLQLLSENTRVKHLQPELSDFCARALEKVSTETTTGQRPLLQSAFERVPFQEGTDNIKNFPNMKVFHAFKKQRDSFYSILREWETHHEETNWQFHLVLGSKIRQLVGQPPELCSLDHLARLFQKQLLESCGYAAHIALGVGSLEGHLKHMNPDKLIKLSERFMQQSSGSGPCQAPKFCHAEVFFSEFLVVADSCTLNHHLTAVMYSELTKFHSRCATVVPGDVPEILHTMRVLAKFLGFVEFLPYSNFPSSFLPARSAMVHSSVIAQCVMEAHERGHLSLTIPWVVEYLSMMDSQALQVPQYRNLLYQLMDVYRNVSVEGESVDVGSFLVLACLGWLFETPNIPSSFFFEYLKSKKSPKPTIVVPLLENKTNLVSRELLYTCCPYLTGIRTMLAEFAAGLHSKTSPIRKIKPISAEIDKPQMSLSSRVQIKLQDSFFRSHSPYLKQLCDVVSERVGETAIALIKSKTVPEHILNGTHILAGWVADKCLLQQAKESSLEVVDLFYNHDAARMLSLVTEQAFTSVQKDAMILCRKHCQTHTEKALSVLLCDLASSEVTAAVVGITSKWALDKCMKWMDMKLRGIVREEVTGSFGGLKRALKAGNKDNQSHPHSAASLEMSSTANSTANLGQAPFSVELSSVSLTNVHPSQLLQVSLLGPVDSARISEGGNVSSIAQECTDCPVTRYIKVANLIMKGRESCPPADKIRTMKEASVNLNTFIASRTTIMPGICAPELLPYGIEDLIETSVELAVLLISHGLLSPCSEHISLVDEIVSLWILLKNLKQKIPVHTILSGISVGHYLQQTAKGVAVWTSLNCLLIKSILCNAVPTFVVEALWLCRLQQLQPKQKQDFMNAAIAFLNSWYSHNAEPQESYIFKEVCFVRLLSVVIKESNCPNLSSSLTNHQSLSFLSL